MSLDRLMDKLEDVQIKFEDREKTKRWLFEYGCSISEGYGLPPKTHPGFVEYCGLHKLAKLYQEAMFAHADPDWGGMTLEFPFNKRGEPRGIPEIVRAEYANHSMPTRKEYLATIHMELGPIGVDLG